MLFGRKGGWEAIDMSIPRCLCLFYKTLDVEKNGVGVSVRSNLSDLKVR